VVFPVAIHLLMLSTEIQEAFILEADADDDVADQAKKGVSKQ